MNTIILVGLASSLIIGLESLSIVSKKFIQKRVNTDVYLGDLAQTITENEIMVLKINQKLNILHESCPAIIALPPPSSVKALKAGRILGKILQGKQKSLRAKNATLLATALTKGFQTKNRVSKQREKNICKFVGPIKHKPYNKVEINNEYSGVLVSIKEKNSHWQFKHSKSRTLWF